MFIPKPRVFESRDEILDCLRGEMEASHRHQCFHYSAWRTLFPCPFAKGSCSAFFYTLVTDFSPGHYEDCCNKTVPIYIMRTKNERLLGWALHHWLYLKWYKPYRNDIEHNQFIAKMFYSCLPPKNTPLVSLVTLVNELHGRISDQVVSYQKEAAHLPVGPYQYPDEPLSCFRDQRFPILQPLFKAFTIIVLEENWNITMMDMGKLQVIISLTGQEDGLSAGLTFDSIKNHVTNFVSETAVQVPLGIAIDFVLALSEREIAVFGILPDPVESTRGPQYLSKADTTTIDEYVQSLGRGDEPVDGRSSTWIDTETHTGWPAASAFPEEKFYGRMENNRRWQLIRECSGLTPHSKPTRRYSI
ncbi:hypothetical protein FAVG1_11913 [Fusarium avenaceum]|nr:hypothetical protein FAVG1_11913 [Fusarium avenaceum]